MLRQVRYFQAVVRNNSFSEAAEECHISQSAISQQIKALEQELGFSLLERQNRKFVLTPAGEHFYKKSLILIADYEQMCSEAAKIARGDEAILKIGYLRWRNFQKSTLVLTFNYCTATMKIYLTCCAPAVRIWCSTISAGHFRMNMSI